jgi:diguanylate cyclase (GGDEF)-like protein
MQKIIFVVDDNSTNLSMAEKALYSQYKIIALPSAAKMFKAMDKFTPDLILLDIEMPEMTGMEALELMKKNPAHEKIPVVFTTGLNDDELHPRAIKAGALDVIKKPFTMSVLQNCVKHYLVENFHAGDKFKNSILIIDDQSTSINSLTNILNSDYILYTTENGPDGIKAAEKYLPDVILLDILMAEMDGLSVITELKKSETAQNIPVIFITSLNDGVNEEKGLSLGAVDYISKPFSPTIVKLRIQNQFKVIEQLRINEKLSLIDQLTDIPNRRSFEIRLDAEWGRAIREKMPISILMIDIDHFKIFNDTYGHQLGDIALQLIAKTFKTVLKRNGDIAARWGGEEFIVLLPNTDSSGAVEVAEIIRKAIEAVEIPVPKKPSAKITASIGVNTQKNYQSKNDFISDADKALYEAKNNGRNQVCIFGL